MTAVIILVNEESGRVAELRVPEWFTKELGDPLETLKKLCNVGDFVELDGRLYRRVRGGFREATDDEAALVTALRLAGRKEKI